MSRQALFAWVLCAFAGWAAAQGLGDAARKESERRAKAKGTSKAPGNAGKVYTGDDLRHGASSAAPEAPPDPSQPGAAPSPASVAGEASGQEDESQWRSRASSLRENVTRLEREVDEADKAATRTAYDGPVNRDGYTNTEHPRAVARAQQAREALATARKALEDFEEQARRAGVPPGWLR